MENKKIFRSGWTWERTLEKTGTEFPQFLETFAWTDRRLSFYFHKMFLLLETPFFAMVLVLLRGSTRVTHLKPRLFSLVDGGGTKGRQPVRVRGQHVGCPSWRFPSAQTSSQLRSGQKIFIYITVKSVKKCQTDLDCFFFFLNHFFRALCPNKKRTSCFVVIVA